MIWDYGLGYQLQVIDYIQDYRGYGVYYDDEVGEWKFGLNEENVHAKETLAE